MSEEPSSSFDGRIFLIALAVLCTVYTAARLGFELTFSDSELITAESLASQDPEPGEDDTNEFFELHPDDAAGLFLGSAALLAGMLALVRPDPRVFLTALGVLTVTQLVLRLVFAAVFGDASVISPDLSDAVQSAVRPDSVATAIAAIVLLLVGMFGFAVLQTTVGFCIGPVSFPVYLLAISVTGLVVGTAVARRAPGRSRLQISLGAIVACALPIAYAGFRFDTTVVPLISGSALVPIAWLTAWIGASRAIRARAVRGPA